MQSRSKDLTFSRSFLAGNAQIRLVFILVIMLLVALVTVVNMMMGDYTNLFVGLTIAGVVLYVGALWRYSWVGAVGVGILGFSIMPTSFMIPADMMCCGFAVAMATTVLMRRAMRAPVPAPAVYPGLSAVPMVVLLSVYFIYLVLQGMWGEISPVYAGQYSLRNTIKGYAEDLLPPFTMVALVVLRYRMPSLGSLTKVMTPLMIVSLILLSAYRLYQISIGLQEVEGVEVNYGPIVPGINLIPGEFALRVTSPIAAIWAASRLLSPYEKLTRPEWFANAILGVLALAGGLLSAGRAVPALCLFGMCAMAFLMRRYGFLMFTVGVAMLFVIAVNLAGSAIDRLPYGLRRSVAMLRIGGNDDKDSIAGSTTMREFLVDEGMKEVRSNKRVFVTGRGVLEFTRGDARINASDQEYDKWMLAVRTGRLHRTSMNQLVRYGVVGAVIYYLAQLAVLIYCLKAFRRFRSRRLPETGFAAFVLAVVVMNTGLGLLQDAPFTNLTAWLVALLIGVAIKRGATAEERLEVPVSVPGRGMPAPVGLAGRLR